MFGQLWDYKREGWARRFFERWKLALRWQRLKPYEKFARMIEGHWDGIALYCQEGNKVPLGFVEGINNKIRVIQRRASVVPKLVGTRRIEVDGRKVPPKNDFGGQSHHRREPCANPIVSSTATKSTAPPPSTCKPI